MAEDPIVAEAKTQAKAKATSADLAADTARELASLAGKPMVALNRPVEDVIGRKLPKDPEEARIQEREAIAIRDQRVAVDTARTQRGLPPKYATE